MSQKHYFNLKAGRKTTLILPSEARPRMFYQGKPELHPVTDVRDVQFLKSHSAFEEVALNADGTFRVLGAKTEPVRAGMSTGILPGGASTAPLPKASGADAEEPPVSEAKTEKKPGKKKK